ncbi:hypothetical protein Pcinc_023777 [Petrolisthes cinctipes]|uniref:Uncharacterized protein n=1 Tax=Petrolisthes cinctipes TaxID=88211 RepID=A0AAE1FCT9_PETCI|nr:hypothetical protein Pcinc_023777 [Petrolisthes cinctipes]
MVCTVWSGRGEVWSVCGVEVVCVECWEEEWAWCVQCGVGVVRCRGDVVRCGVCVVLCGGGEVRRVCDEVWRGCGEVWSGCMLFGVEWVFVRYGGGVVRCLERVLCGEVFDCLEGVGCGDVRVAVWMLYGEVYGGEWCVG